MRTATTCLLALLLLTSTAVVQGQTAIIKEQPAGRVVSMSKRTMAASVVNTPSGTVPETNAMDYMISTLVEGDDGNLYLKNPFTYYHTNSWVKLDHVDGDRYVIHTPQAIYQQGNSTFYLGKICLLSMKDSKTSSLLTRLPTNRTLSSHTRTACCRR